ncbi:PREDICTED: uncharacterized protein LOC109231628 [Nicotiana attenuata]|uniref:uncharacterized protein LOC109231628 n=1 Tax=Nicotiana attenuata TaxID=49451 RepID=UPI000904975C|nr:PREDICTED: uncharacterized protein LOC109231628 [Nicotiana attenuata]
MTKGGQSVENSVTEMGDIIELMQQLISTIGSLAEEVAHLKGLDQAVGELKEQMLNSAKSNEDEAIGPSGAKSRSNSKDSSDKYHVEEEGNRTDGRQYSKYTQISFPRFFGNDLRSWLFKAEQFFQIDRVPTEERNYDDHMEELKKIFQTGNVRDYQTTFERSLTRGNLSQENAISCFIGVLMEQLNIAVKMTNPRSLAQAFKAARMHEAYIDAQSKEIVQRISLPPAQTTNLKRNVDQRFQNKPYLALPAPKKDPPPNSIGVFNRRRLSVEEANEKRAKRLCYFCNEKCVRGHKCKNLMQVYALEVEELPITEHSEDAESSEDSEQIVELAEQIEYIEISVYALNGSLGFKCLRATGFNAKKPLHILIDTGSTHNFINSELVQQLRYPVTTTCSQVVATANGTGMKVDKACRLSWLLQGAEFEANFMLLPLANYDVVLGVEWLVTLGDIKMNFKKLTMEFFYKGRKHMLRGAGNQIKFANAGKIAKLSGNQPQLAMIQVIPCVEDRSMQWYSLETSSENGSSNPDLTALLEKYKDLFDEPTALSPSREIFDHQIILQNGIEPINKRPYRYPAVKRDIIEVLVGKKDGTWRLCVDYRDLNKQTIKNKFPIAIVEDLLDELGGSVVFSKIDLKSGYHQLRMVVDDIPKIAFRIHSGIMSYYRRFIKSFGIISRPLTDLLKKEGFKWSPEATEAFNELKKALTQAHVLALPDFTKTFVVET